MDKATRITCKQPFTLDALEQVMLELGRAFPRTTRVRIHAGGATPVGSGEYYFEVVEEIDA